MLSSPIIERLDHRIHWHLTRLAQRSLTLQPGNSLISPKLTLSVGFSISITLHAATQARRLLAFTAAGLPSPNDESHPMDHDSDSSGHANTQARPQYEKIDKVCLPDPKSSRRLEIELKENRLRKIQEMKQQA